MTFLHVMAAGFAFGIAGNVSLWLIQSLNQMMNAWVAGLRNRQAMMLEAHKFVCPVCCHVAETRACLVCSKLFIPGIGAPYPDFHIHPPSEHK